MTFPDDNPVEEIASEVEETVEDVTEPIADSAAELSRSLQQNVEDLAGAVRLNTETANSNRDAIGRIEANLAELSNRLTGIVADVAQTGIEATGQVAENAATAPEAAAEGVEAVVETATNPPHVSRRGMLGKMKGKGR